MKIATHNTEFLFGEGEHIHSGKTWTYSKDYVEKRIEHLASLYKSIDADILFLQEVASESVIQRVIDRTGIAYKYFLAKPEKTGVGNAVLYKDEKAVCESISATTSLPVFMDDDTDNLGNRIWSRRDFVGIKSTFDGKPIHLFGLHLKARFLVHQKSREMIDYPIMNQVEAADALIRSDLFTYAQAKKMRQVVDEIFGKEPTAQVVVAGDFNSIDRNTSFRIVQGELTGRPDTLISSSHLLVNKDHFSFIGAHGKKLIDHILISPVLQPKVKSVTVMNEGLVYHANTPPNPTFIESDHAPIVMELG